MGEKLKELIDDVIRAIDADVTGYEDICKLNEVRQYLESINTPKHETVEEWETRTGESYPDDGACWCIMTYTPSMHKTKPYYELVEYGTVKADKSCIVANHHGKPEIEG